MQQRRYLLFPDVEAIRIQKLIKRSSCRKSVQSEDRNYEPVTIQLNLERSGLGKNVEYTFKQKPDHVVASGDQMADLFLIWA